MDFYYTEIINFVSVWIIATASICYCYHVTARIRHGLPRLITLLPIFYLFLTLPLNLSSAHLAAATALFIVWLANFKILLFAFGIGPLISSHDPLSRLALLHFIFVALLPITPAKSHPKKWSGPFFLVPRLILLDLIVRVYDYKLYLHTNIMSAIFCYHMYLGIEILFGLSAFAGQVIGIEIEPPFDKPLLTTSFQDFWGHRWNLHVSNILRHMIYNPLLQIGTRLLTLRWVRPPAIFLTFLVSGLMHETFCFYLTRARPTWEITLFFVIQGLCTAVEVVVKPTVVGRRYRLHRMVAGPLVLGFGLVTLVLFFVPQLVRCQVDLKLVNEYSIISGFMRNKITSLASYFIQM